MSATIIPFERACVGETSSYEIVEINPGLVFGPIRYLVALAGARKSLEEGRFPWDSLGWFDDAAQAIDAALSSSRRHGAIPIWDGPGILAPELGPGLYSVKPDNSAPGDAA